MAVGDHVDTFNVEDVGDIEFGGIAASSPATARHRPLDRPPTIGTRRPAREGIKASLSAASLQRLCRHPNSSRDPDHGPHDDAVDSKVAQLGQTFRASVDEPVLVNDQTVIPRGADAWPSWWKTSSRASSKAKRC